MLKNYKDWFANWKGRYLLTEDSDLIEKGVLGTLNKDITKIERMLKALIKSLENKPFPDKSGLDSCPNESGLHPLLQLN